MTTEEQSAFRLEEAIKWPELHKLRWDMVHAVAGTMEFLCTDAEWSIRNSALYVMVLAMETELVFDFTHKVGRDKTGDYEIGKHLYDEGFFYAVFHLPEDDPEDYVSILQRGTLEEAVTACNQHFRTEDYKRRIKNLTPTGTQL